MTTKTKQEQAIEIVKGAAEGATRKDLIEKIKSQLDMSDAGASTYYYNAKKAIENPTPPKAKKEPTPKKAVPSKTKDPIKAAATKTTTKTGEDAKTKTAETVGQPATAASTVRADIQAFIAKIDESVVPDFLKRAQRY